MTAKGPAIKGGCVTRRSTGHLSQYFSQIFLPMQGTPSLKLRGPKTGMLCPDEAQRRRGHVFL
jgi:hypothetical protein